MLDVVAADQHQPPASVDGGRIDHRQPRLTSTRRAAAQTVSAEAAHQPGGKPDQREHDQECNEEARG